MMKGAEWMIHDVMVRLKVGNGIIQCTLEVLGLPAFAIIEFLKLNRY